MCTAWLTSASIPLAARNAVSASATGTSAASSAPKTMSRMPRASGMTVHSARWKSRKIVSLNHFETLAPPTSSIVTFLCSARTRATASSTGCTRSAAVSGSPFSENWSSTCWPLGEVTGARTSFTWPVARTAVRTALAADSSVAVSAGDEPEWETITFSVAGSLMPAFTSVQVARPDSPTPYSAWVMVTWPTALPISTVAMTSASQAPTAASRCRALHPPSVAARLGMPAITHRPLRCCRVHARPCRAGRAGTCRSSGRHRRPPGAPSGSGRVPGRRANGGTCP